MKNNRDDVNKLADEWRKHIHIGNLFFHISQELHLFHTETLFYNPQNNTV